MMQVSHMTTVLVMLSLCIQIRNASGIKINKYVSRTDGTISRVQDGLTITLPLTDCLLSCPGRCREVEEELEVVWQAATRENQHMKDTLLDSSGWALSGSAAASRPSQALNETVTPTQHHLHKSPLFTSRGSPELQGRSADQNNTVDEKQRLDYYC